MRIVDFLNCKIDVSKRVFIPRIETEFWVRKAIREIQNSKCKNQNYNSKFKIKILDIFAGSGCIGIATLKNIKNSQVDFVDIDKKVIEQIKINLKLNKISESRYRIYRSNLFEKLKNRKYDYIFANPPYVAKERIREVDEEVLRTEPWISFFAGKGGLSHIKKFLKEAKNYLKKGSLIYLEFDPKQKEEIEKILKKEGYSDFQFKKDQFKKYRWLVIPRPPLQTPSVSGAGKARLFFHHGGF
jgi:HemK-like putative methylase